MTPNKKIAPVSSNFIAPLLLIFDVITITLSGYGVYFYFEGPVLKEQYHFAIIFILITSVILLYLSGVYKFSNLINPISVIDKLVITFATSFLFFFAICFTLKISEDFSRLWAGYFATICSIATIVIHFSFAKIVNKLSDLRVFHRNVIIIGDYDNISIFLKNIKFAENQYIVIDGFFSDEISNNNKLEYNHIGMINGVLDYVRDNYTDDIFIAMPWSEDRRILGLIDDLRELPVNVYLVSDMIGFRVNLRQPPEHFNRFPVHEIIGRPLSGWDLIMKAAVEYALATFALLALLPVFTFIAVAIKIDSPGPVFFLQKRLGFNNQIFTIFKFRTMYASPEQTGNTQQATRNDPRVTRLGWFLRRTSLDELPQLLNVLNGTMSLVGPRPHALDHNEEYAKKIRGYFSRHRVKPGITGWAQVNGFRGETDTVEKMEKRVSYDIYYVDNWSILLDLKILLKTTIIMFGGNAY